MNGVHESDEGAGRRLEEAVQWRLRLAENDGRASLEFEFWLRQAGNQAAWDQVCRRWDAFDRLAEMPAMAAARQAALADAARASRRWTMQRLADILDAPVDRPTILETTALGAAWLAGSKAGVWPKAKDFARSWALERRFKPEMDAKTRSAKLAGWRDAVRRTLSAS